MSFICLFSHSVFFHGHGSQLILVSLREQIIESSYPFFFAITQKTWPALECSTLPTSPNYGSPEPNLVMVQIDATLFH